MAEFFFFFFFFFFVVAAAPLKNRWSELFWFVASLGGKKKKGLESEPVRSSRAVTLSLPARTEGRRELPLQSNYN